MPIKPTAWQTMKDKIGYPTCHVNFPQENGTDKTYRIREKDYNPEVFGFFDKVISASNNKPKINLNKETLNKLIDNTFRKLSDGHASYKYCNTVIDWNTIFKRAINDFTLVDSDGGKTITTHEVYQLYERVSAALPDYDEKK